MGAHRVTAVKPCTTGVILSSGNRSEWGDWFDCPSVFIANSSRGLPRPWCFRLDLVLLPALLYRGFVNFPHQCSLTDGSFNGLLSTPSDELASNYVKQKSSCASGAGWALLTMCKILSMLQARLHPSICILMLAPFSFNVFNVLNFQPDRLATGYLGKRDVQRRCNNRLMAAQ